MKSNFSFHDVQGTVYYLPNMEEQESFLTLNHIPFTAVNFVKYNYEIREASITQYKIWENYLKLCLCKKGIKSHKTNPLVIQICLDSPDILRVEMRKRDILGVYR